jgi:hypothetical protein
MPTCTSGIPKRLAGVAIRRSQQAAISSPAPRQNPSILAITGTGNERFRRFAIQAHHLVYVGTADPGLACGAREDDGSCGVVLGDPREGTSNFRQRGSIQNVQLFGAGYSQPVDQSFRMSLGIDQQRAG